MHSGGKCRRDLSTARGTRGKIAQAIDSAKIFLLLRPRRIFSGRYEPEENPPIRRVAHKVVHSFVNKAKKCLVYRDLAYKLKQYMRYVLHCMICWQRIEQGVSTYFCDICKLINLCCMASKITEIHCHVRQDIRRKTLLMHRTQLKLFHQRFPGSIFQVIDFKAYYFLLARYISASLKMNQIAG